MCAKFFQRKLPAVLPRPVVQKVQKVKDMNLAAREYYRCVSEEVHAVESNTKSTGSSRLTQFVSAGNITDCKKVVVVRVRTFPKRRIIPDEEGRPNEGLVLLWKSLWRSSLVKHYGEFLSSWIVGVLNELLNNSGPARKSGLRSHLAENGSYGASFVKSLPAAAPDWWTLNHNLDLVSKSFG